MDAYSSLGFLMLLFAFSVQCIIFWLQLNAWLRHRHSAFRYLAISSVIGMVYSVASIPLYVLPIGPDVFWILLAGATVCMILSAIVGIIGTARLFRSYAELAERTSAEARLDR